MIERIKADNITIYFDPASVGTMKDVSDNEMHQWFSLMNVLLLNEEESIYLTGSVDIERALDYLLDYSEVVVIKRGSMGAIAKTRGFDSISVPAVAANVTDTTGAGDSFLAGFLSFLARGEVAPGSDLAYGARWAAATISIEGSQPAPPPL
jgi:sugar/nucleoside kinase (ribokinase family)